MLVEVLLDWANERGVHTLQLMVTDNNDAAIRFYQSRGFTLTGRTEPYPNAPALRECEMARAVLAVPIE